MPEPPEGLEGLEYAPEATAFANWLLEGDDLDAAIAETSQPRKKFLGLF